MKDAHALDEGIGQIEIDESRTVEVCRLGDGTHHLLLTNLARDPHHLPGLDVRAHHHRQLGESLQLIHDPIMMK